MSGIWILNWIFLFILIIFHSLSLSPSIYFANSPLSLLPFSYFSYDSNRRSKGKRSDSKRSWTTSTPWYSKVIKTRTTCYPLNIQWHPSQGAPRTRPPPPSRSAPGHPVSTAVAACSPLLDDPKLLPGLLDPVSELPPAVLWGLNTGRRQMFSSVELEEAPPLPPVSSVLSPHFPGTTTG